MYNEHKTRAIVQYIRDKNVDHGHIPEHDNMFYIYYLANLYHTIDWTGDLHRRYLLSFMKLTKSDFEREYYTAVVQLDIGIGIDFDNLSISDKQSIDKAIEAVDAHTYNFD